MRTLRVVGFLVLIAWLGVGAAGSALAEANPQHILAPTGKLRADLYTGTPTSVLKQPGVEPRGVGYELGKELAKRLGVPYEPVIFPKNADVQAAIKEGKVDVIFTNATPARAKEMDVAVEMLSSRKLDAFATNKGILFEMADKLPGAKVLDGRWGTERHSIAIPKGREDVPGFQQRI